METSTPKTENMLYGKKILHITHKDGGGIDTFIFNLVNQLSDEGATSYILRPANKHQGIVTDSSKKTICKIKLGSEDLSSLLRSLSITHIHIHHTIGYPKRFVEEIITAKIKHRIWATFTAHDYYSYCINTHLVRPNGKICLEYNEGDCSKCYKTNTSFLKRLLQETQKERRNLYDLLLANCDKVTIPNEDMYKRLKDAFPTIKFHIIEHNFTSPTKDTKIFPQNDSTKKVAILGNVGEHKGSRIILSLANYINKKNEPLELMIIGSSNMDDKLSEAGVFITGPYKNDLEAIQLLKRLRPDMIFIPSTCIETYSYTLSLGLLTELPCLTFDMGAPSNRIKKMGLHDCIIPLSRQNDFSFICKKLLSLHTKGYHYKGHYTDPNCYYSNTNH